MRYDPDVRRLDAVGASRSASRARQLLFDAASGTYLPSEGAVGACAGVFDLASCLRDGTAAGGGAAAIVRGRRHASDGAAGTAHCRPARTGPRSSTSRTT